MKEESALISFRAICNFVSDLSEEYGKKYKPLNLYNRLISKTQISHDKAIQKHLDLFHAFCVANRDNLPSQDAEKLVESKISYSDRVFFDIAHVLKMADDETRPIIWQHILTISALVDPAGNAKEILRKNAEDGKAGFDETNFLTNIISKVEQNVKPDANPMDAISAMMNSGIFTDLLSGMQGGLSSGKMDMSKMLGAVQGLIVKMGEQAGDDPESKQALGAISNVVGGLGNSSGPPDMSGLMGLMSTMMGGMNKSANPDDKKTI